MTDHSVHIVICLTSVCYNRTMFIIEGLVYYLPAEAFKQSLTSISETAVAGSRLFFDFLHLDSLANNVLHPGLETLLMVRELPSAFCLCKQVSVSFRTLGVATSSSCAVTPAV